MEWEAPDEKQENINEKIICKNCGNDTSHVYIKVIIDDGRHIVLAAVNFLLKSIPSRRMP